MTLPIDDEWFNHTIELVHGRGPRWNVICMECSQAIQDYVYPCAKNKWPDPQPPEYFILGARTSPRKQ